MLNPDDCNHVQMVDGSVEEEHGEVVKYRQHRCERERGHRGAHRCVSCKQKFGVQGWTNGGNRDNARTLLSSEREQQPSSRDWGYDLVPELSDAEDNSARYTPLDTEMRSHRMRSFTPLSR